MQSRIRVNKTSEVWEGVTPVIRLKKRFYRWANWAIDAGLKASSNIWTSSREPLKNRSCPFPAEPKAHSAALAQGKSFEPLVIESTRTPFR